MSKNKESASRLFCGLLLAVVAASVVLLIQFSATAQEIISRYDQSIATLVPALRTQALTSFFSFATFLANWQTIVVLSLATLGILIALREWLAGLLFGLVVLLEETSFFILKLVFARARPDEALSLITEESFSLPSGHALRATVVFGLLAYFIHKLLISSAAKSKVIVVYGVTVILVAASRVYLGVHYLSDVVASMLFGALMLGIFIALCEHGINSHHTVFRQPARSREVRYLFFVPLLTMAFALIFHARFIDLR